MNNPNINLEFSALFFELFQSELLVELPSELKENKAIFLADKQVIFAQLGYNLPVIFQGFGQRISLIEAIDETEFHLAILSFLKRYGNIYRKTEYLDDRYEESVSIALYNPFTKEIEVITKQHSHIFLKEENDFAHLNWLSITKELLFQILTAIKLKGLDSFIIKTNYPQYLEIQNREKSQIIEEIIE